MAEASQDSEETPLPSRVSRTKTIDDACEAFAVHENTIRDWIKKGCPHSRRGALNQIVLDLSEVAAWKREQNITPGRPKRNDADDLDAARCRKENAMADWHEMRVAQARGNLLPADEVQEQWAKRVSAAKSVLIGMGAAIAPQLVGMNAAESQALIDTHVRDALTRLSEGNDDDMDEPPPGDGGDVASPGPDASERVGVPVSDSTAGY